MLIRDYVYSNEPVELAPAYWAEGEVVEKSEKLVRNSQLMRGLSITIRKKQDKV